MFGLAHAKWALKQFADNRAVKTNVVNGKRLVIRSVESRAVLLLIMYDFPLYCYIVPAML